MAHAQKPDLVFQRNGRVHLNRLGGQFSRLQAAEVCGSACSEIECKTNGYPLHSPVSPSLPRPCVTLCHQISTELYLMWWPPCFTGAPLFSSFKRITKSRRKGGPKNGRTKYTVACLSVTLLLSYILPAFPLPLLPHFFREPVSAVGSRRDGQPINRAASRQK